MALVQVSRHQCHSVWTFHCGLWPWSCFFTFLFGQVWLTHTHVTWLVGQKHVNWHTFFGSTTSFTSFDSVPGFWLLMQAEHLGIKNPQCPGTKFCPGDARRNKKFTEEHILPCISCWLLSLLCYCGQCPMTFGSWAFGRRLVYSPSPGTPSALFTHPQAWKWTRSAESPTMGPAEQKTSFSPKAWLPNGQRTLATVTRKGEYYTSSKMAQSFFVLAKRFRVLAKSQLRTLLSFQWDYCRAGQKDNMSCFGHCLKLII